MERLPTEIALTAQTAKFREEGRKAMGGRS
jgi:hypothetical protein